MTAISRRTALKAAAVVPLIGSVSGQERVAMYGLIGRIKAYPGKRDDLAAILLESISGAPGCLSYVVAKDPKDPDSLWMTEVWESEADHQASLALPTIRDAITKGRPLIASFDERHTTEPIGGQGISKGH
jgi:quinol monooxygenase YgiN